MLQVELALLRNEQVLGATTAPEARKRKGGHGIGTGDKLVQGGLGGRDRVVLGGLGGRERGAQGVMPLNLSIRAGEKLQVLGLLGKTKPNKLLFSQ